MNNSNNLFHAAVVVIFVIVAFQLASIDSNLKSISGYTNETSASLSDISETSTEINSNLSDISDSVSSIDDKTQN